MKPVLARWCKHLIPALTEVVFLGCDKVKRSRVSRNPGLPPSAGQEPVEDVSGNLLDCFVAADQTCNPFG